MTTWSSIGSISEINLSFIGPLEIIELALRHPPFERARSVYNSLLIKSLSRFPKFVSSVLTLENLASKSTSEHPIISSSWLSNSFVYFEECSKISMSSLNSSVIIIFSEMNNLFSFSL